LAKLSAVGARVERVGVQSVLVDAQPAFGAHRQKSARRALLDNNRPAVARLALDGDLEGVHTFEKRKT
jgi:hypothetical protein